jgi:hypothetical protein
MIEKFLIYFYNYNAFAWSYLSYYIFFYSYRFKLFIIFAFIFIFFSYSLYYYNNIVYQFYGAILISSKTLLLIFLILEISESVLLIINYDWKLKLR